MLLDNEKPISEPCARSVEPAVASLLRLGITQQEVVEHLSRALGIVRCVLDYQQSIPRHQLAVLGRSLWTKIAQIRGVPPETVRRVRSTITACVADLRLLPEESTGLPEEGGSPSQPALQQAEDERPSREVPVEGADTEQRPDPQPEEGNGHRPAPSAFQPAR